MLRALVVLMVSALALGPATDPTSEAAPAPVSGIEQSPAPTVERIARSDRSEHLVDSIFQGQRVLTYYGNPLSSQMGVLGEAEPEAVITWLLEEAENYEKVDGTPVRPALHLVATVAQADPMADGKYRLRMPDSLIQEWVDIAAANGLLIFLDLQPGLSSVREEVEAVRPWLTKEHVHLALDPEFNMPDGKLPGRVIGTMSAAEINEAAGILNEIVGQYNLPRKALVVYQFTPDMLTDKAAIQLQPNVDVAVVMDGFGSPELKTRHYEWYVADEPVQYGGIKLFYRQDEPLMSPEEILALEPKPNIIIYQ